MSPRAENKISTAFGLVGADAGADAVLGRAFDNMLSAENVTGSCRGAMRGDVRAVLGRDSIWASDSHLPAASQFVTVTTLVTTGRVSFEHPMSCGQIEILQGFAR